MAANDQGKAEDFKRATASALRAIARTTDVQVAYQPGPSGLAGKRARLPTPSRALPAPEMAKLRGMADAMALRLRHHDDALHTARAPASREAKEAYDALEQARVEIVGAAHMDGVSANLRGKLNEECETDGLSRMTRRDQLPLPAALSLLARDRMDPASVPDAAQHILSLWRDTLSPPAETALAELAAARDDQSLYTRASRKLLAALDMAESEAETEENDESEENDENGEDSSQQDNSQARRRPDPERGAGHARARAGNVRGRGRRPGSRRRKRPRRSHRRSRRGPGRAAAAPRRSRRTTSAPPTAPSPAPSTRKSTPRRCATRRS